MSAARARCAVLLASMLASSACTRVQGHVASHQQQDHGFTVGQQIAQRLLDCGADGGRVLGDTASVQLVTFATEDDCSMCHAHLAGLDDLAGKDSIHVPEFILLWAPVSELQRAAMFARKRTPRPVCVDTSGIVWSEHVVEHTPVTVFLDHGMIRYLHDAPLASARSESVLLADLARLTEEARAQ